MEYLYRKIVSKNGRVRYEETFQHWQGDPKDGIWYVKKEKGMRHFYWLCKRLEDLPKARKLAELEPYRDDIINIISAGRTKSLHETVTKIFELLVK